MRWRGKGDWDRRVENHSMQIGIRVLGMIHIHTRDGIGVGLCFGLFSVPRVDFPETCTRKIQKGQHTHGERERGH